MKHFNIGDLIKIENPNPSTSPYVQRVLEGHDFGSAVGILGPHTQGHYHYHRNHESVFIVLSGEAVEYVEGKEYSLKVNDIMYIAPREKHMMINRTDKDFRYFEFHMPAPGDTPDAVDVELKEGH